MQTQTLSQFGLRQSQAAARSSDVHAHSYMRTGICAQDILCVQEFETPSPKAYAPRMKHFAQNVAILAEQVGGQQSLAAAIGVNQSTVSKWIKGGTTKDVVRIQAMAELAGVTADQFASAPLADHQGARIKAEERILLMLPVALPSGPALEAMFATMLVGAEKRSPAELARRLAEGLPRGLSQALATRSEPATDEALSLDVAAQSHATYPPKAQ